MFSRAADKLEDTRTILDNIRRASDAIMFKAAFNAFLNSARAITNALQKDGAEVKGFDEWYQEKQAEMRADELLRFVHEARISDFHRGEGKLRFRTKVQCLTVEVPPGARLAIDQRGAFWKVDEGLPKERWIPVKHKGRMRTQATIPNAPRSHLSKKLDKRDPLSICELALAYYETLVHQARERFSP